MDNLPPGTTERHISSALDDPNDPYCLACGHREEDHGGWDESEPFYGSCTVRGCLCLRFE